MSSIFYADSMEFSLRANSLTPHTNENTVSVQNVVKGSAFSNIVCPGDVVYVGRDKMDAQRCLHYRMLSGGCLQGHAAPWKPRSILFPRPQVHGVRMTNTVCFSGGAKSVSLCGMKFHMWLCHCLYAAVEEPGPGR